MLDQDTTRNDNPEELDELEEAENIEEGSELDSNSDSDSEVEEEAEEDQEDFFSLDDIENDSEEGEQEEDAQQDEIETDENAEEDQPETEADANEAPGNQEEVLSDEAAFYDQVTEAAKRRVKEITGSDYDEFDPKHNVILAGESSKIINRFGKEREAINEMEAIAAQNGGDKFKQIVQQQLENITVSEYRALKAAEDRGDYSKTLAKIKEIAASVGNSKVKDAAREKAKGFQPVPQKKAVPPKTIPSGTGSAASKANNGSDVLTPEDLGLYT